MRRTPLRFPPLLAACLSVGLFAAPLVASADLAPAPKKKGCAVEEGPSGGREGALGFGLSAAALVGFVVVRRARRPA